MTSDSLAEKFKNVRLLAMDFDGVMTDGCVYVNQRGEETVKCSRKDGLGILMLKKNGIESVVISKEVNPVVAARCKKLQIECWQAVESSEGKLEILRRLSAEKKIPMENILYIGDDLNDMAVLAGVGLPVTVADGHPRVKSVCQYITEAKGGEHSVREVCEKILAAQNRELSF